MTNKPNDRVIEIKLPNRIGYERIAMECLTAYAFPGNVREPENEIERAMAMAENGKPIKVLHLYYSAKWHGSCRHLCTEITEMKDMELK